MALILTKDLASKAGEYLSQAHVLCDIVASIAFALSEAADTIPDEDTFINACKAADNARDFAQIG